MSMILKKCVVFCLSLVLFISLASVLANLELNKASNVTSHVTSHVTLHVRSNLTSFYGYKDLFDEQDYEENYDTEDMQAKFWGVPSF